MINYTAVFTTGYDRYDYSISSTANPVNAYKLAFDINQSYFKAQFNYFLNAKHGLEFGFNTLYYKLDPGNYGPFGKSSLIITGYRSPGTGTRKCIVSER